jgi:hypothetical protein
VRRLELPRVREQHAAAQLVALHAAQVDGAAHPRARLGGGLAVHLQPAHLRLRPVGQRDHVVSGLHPPSDDRAGDHRAEPLHGEDAIQRHAEQPVGGPRGHLGRDLAQLCAELVEPGAAHRRHRDDRRRGQERLGHRTAHVAGDHLQPGVVHEVALGQHDHPAPDAEQLADVQVLARLRHDAFIGGDDQQHHIHAAGAGDHGLQEPLVARDVDQPEAPPAHVEVREAELDRDAALFLFLEPIGLDPRQRAHQRGLAVIDVPGGAEDDRIGLH